MQIQHAVRVPWDAQAAGSSEVERLVYRSRILGADPTVVNWKGGNTSAKVTETDHTGRSIRVVWVKGSGSDLGTIQADDFAALRLDEVLALESRDTMSDEAMVEYLLRCMLHPHQPRPSIETLLHAFLPFAHVDHTHPDAIIAFCTTRRGEALTAEAFGDRMVWVPYQRPGFALSKRVADAVRAQPACRAVFLAKHGLVTWGDDAEECYTNTVRMIEEGERFIAARATRRPVFGGVKVSVDPSRREDIWAELLPTVRGAVSQKSRKVLFLDDGEDVLAFAGSAEAAKLSQVGAACPDHLVHTKHLPLFVPFDPAHDDAARLRERFLQECGRYGDAYLRYVETYRRPGDPTGDPAPRIILIPGLGLVTTGREKFLATQAGGLYRRAIAVMHGASMLDEFVSLSPQEAYDVEYWPLELYKLTLAPPERELTRRIAFVTGAAGGIGRAIAARLAEEGAHVVLADIDVAGADELARELTDRLGPERALAVRCDVTDEASVAEAFRTTIRAFGGLDILVSNAGIAVAAPLEATTLEQWRRVHEVLLTGYFLVSREALKTMRVQGLGGSIIFVASKNALVPSKEASAYNAAKAAELHLARTMAEEAGPAGIRVNAICPDAVLEGSRIWTTQWREERARAYGVRPDQLEEFYRQRATLKANVYPKDVAEAAVFFASDRSAKTTGGILTVDAGVPGAYVR